MERLVTAEHETVKLLLQEVLKPIKILKKTHFRHMLIFWSGRNARHTFISPHKLTKVMKL